MAPGFPRGSQGWGPEFGQRLQGEGLVPVPLLMGHYSEGLDCSPLGVGQDAQKGQRLRSPSLEKGPITG